MNKFNFSAFVERARAAHGDLYNYICSEQKGNKFYIYIECSKHGVFKQRSDSHTKGGGCRHCVHEAIPLKRTIEDFIKEASVIHDNKFDYSLVTTTKTTSKIDIICKDHGIFSQTVAHHLVSRGCPECAFEKIRLSREDFIAKSAVMHEDKYDYSGVVLTKGFNQKVLIVCPEHGEFSQTAGTHMLGRGCAKCGVERSLLQRYSEYTTEYFIERAKQTHKDKYSYDFAEYVNTETKVKITCDVHGVFEQRPLCHVRGKGCAQCTYDKTTYNMVDRYTEDEELGQRLGSIYIIEMSDGEESFLKLGITCNKKGREKVYKRQKDIYDYSFVYEEEMINIDSANLERKIMRQLKSLGYHYKPTKKFTGYTECFSNEAKDLIIKYIEEATSG